MLLYSLRTRTRNRTYVRRNIRLILQQDARAALKTNKYRIDLNIESNNKYMTKQNSSWRRMLSFITQTCDCKTHCTFVDSFKSQTWVTTERYPYGFFPL